MVDQYPRTLVGIITSSSNPHFSIISVDLREIKEIRDSMGSLDFKSNAAGQAKIADPQCCFVIYYGSEFKLKTLSVAGV